MQARLKRNLTGWALILPLVVILVPFFVLPIIGVAATSFLESDGFGGIIPDFTWDNYVSLFTSQLTFDLYWSTIKFTFFTWVFSLILGFWVAYFLVFHVRNQLLALGLFLLCTVPFWTSNIIRMISWIPLLGKEGLINSALLGAGVIDQPLEVLLFSSLAVVIAYVHQLTIFMIVPIFNSMARIDKRLVEAAVDAGASKLDVVRLIILPMSKSGIALGSIFVVSIVMGDFFVVKVMSRRRVGLGGRRLLRGHRRPAVPVRGGERDPAYRRRLRHGGADPAHRRRPQGAVPMSCARHRRPRHRAGAAIGRAATRRPELDLLRPRRPFHLLCHRALWADDLHLHPVVPGCPRRPGLPDEGLLAALVRGPLHPGPHRRRQGLVRSLDQAGG